MHGAEQGLFPNHHDTQGKFHTPRTYDGTTRSAPISEPQRQLTASTAHLQLLQGVWRAKKGDAPSCHLRTSGRAEGMLTSVDGRGSCVQGERKLGTS
jgi:hypothetical protein